MTDELLREILAELRALRVALRSPESVLVDAIASETDGKKFSIAELLEFAEVTPALRSAIEQAGAWAEDGKKLGNLLTRLERRTFEGWRIVRVGEDREGILRVCTRKPVVAE